MRFVLLSEILILYTAALLDLSNSLCLQQDASPSHYRDPESNQLKRVPNAFGGIINLLAAKYTHTLGLHG